MWGSFFFRGRELVRYQFTSKPFARTKQRKTEEGIERRTCERKKKTLISKYEMFFLQPRPPAIAPADFLPFCLATAVLLFYSVVLVVFLFSLSNSNIFLCSFFYITIDRLEDIAATPRPILEWSKCRWGFYIVVKAFKMSRLCRCAEKESQNS